MDQQNNESQEPTLEQQQIMQMVVELRRKAFMQVIYGLAWWLASATAMYFAMTSTGDSIYWFGGAIGSLFHWYRAFKMITATYQVGAKKILRNEAILITVTLVIAMSSAAKIVPEYFRMDSPTVGTCWSERDSNALVPVACWSPNVSLKTIDFADSAEACPSISDGYFDPDARESRYTCVLNVD